MSQAHDALVAELDELLSKPYTTNAKGKFIDIIMEEGNLDSRKPFVEAILATVSKHLAAAEPEKINKDTKFNPSFGGFIEIYANGTAAKVFNATVEACASARKGLLNG